MEREDIHILNRFSNLEETEIAKALQDNVYNDKQSWEKFIRLFIISLGVGFTVSGILFFFAYNWADLHKSIKIGLIEGLLIVATTLLLLPKIRDTTRNIILTGASVLVGVLFAVFGQIYQTGANSYDFFLAWTIFVTLWAIVSNFAPLWLIYILLINVTLILYSQQVAKDWSDVFVFTLLFSLNIVVLISAILWGKHKLPNWFLYCIALAAIGYSTIGIYIGIFEQYQISFLFLIGVATITYALGIWHGLKTKSSFYLAIIPFSLIIICIGLIIKASNDEVMFLFISIFIIASVTLTIINLINLQKKWLNEK